MAFVFFTYNSGDRSAVTYDLDPNSAPLLFVEYDTSPVPVIIGTNPTSPSNDDTPTVTGTAIPGHTVNVYDGQAGIADVAVSHSTDDAEEENDGDMDLDSGDLDFTQKKVAVRFQNIDIPQGGIIQNAYIQFTAEDDHEHESTGVDIFAEAIDDAH